MKTIEEALRDRLDDAHRLVGMQAIALEQAVSRKPTPADLWAMVVNLAAEVETRIPADDVLAQVNHDVLLRRMSSAFWTVFRDE